MATPSEAATRGVAVEPEASRPSLGTQLGRLGDLVKQLVAAHVDLAKAEAVERLQAGLRDAAWTTFGAGLLSLGWLLTALAVGVGLGERLGTARGLLVVAVLHVAAGGWLAARAGRRLSRGLRSGWPAVRAVVRRDRAFLGRLLGGGPGPLRRTARAD